MYTYIHIWWSIKAFVVESHITAIKKVICRFISNETEFRGILQDIAKSHPDLNKTKNLIQFPHFQWNIAEIAKSCT
jgi:hypothetical protein